MPLEIKELHIKVSVSPGGGGGDVPAATGGGDAAAASKGAAAGQEQLIQTIIEQVMEILKEKMER
ncbi:MAG: DUF5908 family protein [Bacteroidota bacterium]